MDFRSDLVISLKKDDKNFSFSFQHGSSFQECYDALQDAAKEIVRLAEEAKKAQEASAPAEEKVSEGDKDVQEQS